MSSRDAILRRLRAALQEPDVRFPPLETPALAPAERMAVTRAEGDRWALAQRFARELEALHGTSEIVETNVEARLATISRLSSWMEAEQAERRTSQPDPGAHQVLTWAADALPIEGLVPALTDVGFHLVTPTDLHDEEQRDGIRSIRAGLTSVDAAFASTGSVVLGGAPGRSRAASLTPFRHLVLVPLSRLYPTIEDWMADLRRRGTLVDYLHSSSNVALISGPSKSADIEGNLTMGVHGPKIVHAILFDDIEALIRG